MMQKCYECGMLRSPKDLVLLEDGNYICFSCWNKTTSDKVIKTKKKRIID
ncbi:MAG: hypothetical protein JSV62_14200 [Promethearchaeota archaeon]|nr:MAG: hypothetical protein JSV62_14200 [Candidatus Lokiarchaeota archaeon]